MRPLRPLPMPALGDEFRSAREARGLSLSDVAERLHIRTVYLGAIEDEDWKAIGAPVYVRGFMRTYARFLGLDAESAVARFSAAAAPARPEERPREERGGERSGPSIVAILAVLVAVAVVAYVGYAYFNYRFGVAARPVAVASPVPSAVRSPIKASTAPVTAVAAAAPRPTQPGKHALPGLRIHLTQRSWLRVSIDGTVVAEGTFPAGTAKSFAGNVADVRAGNAGGVNVAVNGRAVGPLGASGAVIERQFVLGGE